MKGLVLPSMMKSVSQAGNISFYLGVETISKDSGEAQKRKSDGIKSTWSQFPGILHTTSLEGNAPSPGAVDAETLRPPASRGGDSVTKRGWQAKLHPHRAGKLGNRSWQRRNPSRLQTEQELQGGDCLCGF